jgi:D-beta-D-heptose 7-phosphate kinase / D-beta-D-heptose 1-phosphate adenosyltransferase
MRRRYAALVRHDNNTQAGPVQTGNRFGRAGKSMELNRAPDPGRPIVGQRECARVLAAMAAVDALVIFCEPAPLGLILAARPDDLVKGGDYEVETVVGAEQVPARGGPVKIVPIVDGYSTNRLIARGAGS